jgi:hypothetical protein
MPRPLRSELFLPHEVSICHVVQRCVRRMFLAGLDDETGKDYTYRREWIRQRLEKLASVFAIDVLTYAILSNHLHVVIRNRPDVVKTWSDKEVALRWLQIFPGKRIEEQLGNPTQADVDSLANDSEKLEAIRSRFSDISWFMRAISEPIARRANSEEKCTGAFWEGRFKAQRLLDEAGLLACCMYVDLNPIRAAMVESIEDSLFSSAYDRLKASHRDTHSATHFTRRAELVECEDGEFEMPRPLRSELFLPHEVSICHVVQRQTVPPTLQKERSGYNSNEEIFLCLDR